MRVLVCSIEGPNGFSQVVDLVDEQKALQLAKAPNATVIRRRKDRRIVEIHLRSLCDESSLPRRMGDPRKYSKHHQTDQNPENVWYLRHLPDETEDLYRLSVTDCLKRAA